MAVNVTYIYGLQSRLLNASCNKMLSFVAGTFCTSSVCRGTPCLGARVLLWDARATAGLVMRGKLPDLCSPSLMERWAGTCVEMAAQEVPSNPGLFCCCEYTKVLSQT